MKIDPEEFLDRCYRFSTDTLVSIIEHNADRLTDSKQIPETVLSNILSSKIVPLLIISKIGDGLGVTLNIDNGDPNIYSAELFKLLKIIAH